MNKFYKLCIILSLLASLNHAGHIHHENYEDYENYFYDQDEIDGRIVGGSVTTINNFPHQVSLTFYNVTSQRREHLCGGSIISQNLILTAAHCSNGPHIAEKQIDINSYRIRVGSSSSIDGGNLISIEQIINHENWNITGGMEYDISVMVLSESLTYDDNIRPIPIASSLRAAGTKTIVSGWGHLSDGALETPKDLHFVEINLISRDDCQIKYGVVEFDLPETIFCAGTAEGGKDACQFDSGDALTENREVIGTVSFGFGCGDADFPGVYTNVFMLRDWINNQIIAFSQN